MTSSDQTITESASTTVSDAERLSWLWRNYAKPHVPLLALALLLMVIAGAILGAVSWLMEPMFDSVFVAGSTQAMYLVGFGMLALFALRAFTSTGQRVLLTLVGERMSAKLRGDLLGHAMALDGDFHAAHPPGYMIERVQGDTRMIIQNARALMIGAGRDTVALIALIGVAVNVDLVWTIVAFAGAPVVLMPGLLVQRYIRRKSATAREVAAQMSLRLDEVLHGMTTIKLNKLERYQSQRYERENRRQIKSETQSELGRALMPALIDVFTGVGIFAVIVYGGGEIIAGEKTIGQFMSFFTAIALAFDPLRRLGNLAGVAKTLAASLERVQMIFSTKPTLVRPAQPRSVVPGDIVFDDVSVSFGETRALSGLSFVAKKGETTALVGASGAGKSTVFHALTRLAQLKEGQITLGGVDITQTDTPELRELFSVVSQDTLLFDDSLGENITFGADLPEFAVTRALDDAFVSDFLPQLPAGLNSPAGARGSNLSGGQRQRVAIARALLRDAPILLLDEATSALDAQSEVKVQQALGKLSDGRTTLVIAHRLSTIRDADQIIVMDRGRAIEAGTQDQLLALGGAYARLHALQFKD